MAQKGDQNGVVADGQNVDHFLGEPEQLRFGGVEKFGVELKVIELPPSSIL